MRPVEKFFQSVFAPALFHTRKPVVVVFSIFTLAVLFGYTLQMEKQTSAVNLWPAWFPMQVYRRADDEAWPDHYGTNWGCEPGCEDVYFVWGVKADGESQTFLILCRSGSFERALSQPKDSSAPTGPTIRAFAPEN
jgi:hypothetical protein